MTKTERERITHYIDLIEQAIARPDTILAKQKNIKTTTIDLTNDNGDVFMPLSTAHIRAYVGHLRRIVEVNL